MRFSYISFRSKYFPIIPVTPLVNSTTFETNAIVDSGATLSLFHAPIARDLGIDVEAGEKHVFQGVSAKLIGYIHNIKMLIAGKEINCKVAFSDELSTSFNLLGRETVFAKFIIIFNEKDRELRIESI